MLAVSQNVHSAALPQRSHGEGALSVKLAGGTSRIDNLRQQGSAKIRLPNKAGDGLEAVMINSSGGMTGGDSLDWKFEAGRDTGLTVATQACERVYEAVVGEARTEIYLRVGDNAKLAWLPQETILFNRSAYSRTIDVDMESSGELLMLESLVFGRAAMGEVMDHGLVQDRWRIRKGGKLIHAEDVRLSGDIANALGGVGVSAGHGAVATVLLIAPRAEGLLALIRTLLGNAGGASFWRGKLLIRVTAPSSYALREKLMPLINLVAGENRLPKTWKL